MGDTDLEDMLRLRLAVVEGDRELARRFNTLFEFESGEPGRRLSRARRRH